MGDLGTRTADQFAVLEQLIQHPFETAILTGDVAYPDGRLEDFEAKFFGVYAPVIDRVPFFPASGNHEYRTAAGGPFFSSFALPGTGGPAARERWYSVDWGPVHFAVIDTEAVGAEQAAWLDHDLASTSAVWRIVAGHKPPFSSGHHGSDPAVRDAFVPVFERNRVDLVLSGHDHNYERTGPINDVTYVITGGGGVGTRAVGQSEFTAFSLQVAHFVFVEATQDTLTLWAIDATGQVFDTLRLDAR
jgi:3',5'-cyclic AMP phosphodiesterase CpdA